MNTKWPASTAVCYHNNKRFAELGLPNLLKVWHATAGDKGRGSTAAGKYRCANIWRKLAADLPALEAQLTAWEGANPTAYRALPWYEAREAFKAQKARGEVRWPTWWELAGAVDAAGHSLKKAAQTVR